MLAWLMARWIHRPLSPPVASAPSRGWTSHIHQGESDIFEASVLILG